MNRQTTKNKGTIRGHFFLYCLTILIAVACLIECTKEDDTLKVSPDKLEFDISGGVKSFKVTSKVDWTVDFNADDLDRITVSPLSGSGNGTVTVTVKERMASLNGQIVVSGSDYVLQRGTVEVLVKGIDFTLSPEEVDFPDNGGLQTFKISALKQLPGTSWTVSSDANWLTVSPSSGSKDGTFTVSATKNTSTLYRNANVDVNWGIKKTIPVYQSGVYSKSVIFWISKDLGCGYISVRLEGHGASSIIGYYPSGSPGCSSGLNAVFTYVLPGTYTYSASCSGGREWSGSVSVVKDDNSCVLIKLE